jgi:hypothetical protein
MSLADHGVLAASTHVIAVSGHDRETRSGKGFEQTSIAKAVTKRQIHLLSEPMIDTDVYMRWLVPLVVRFA